MNINEIGKLLLTLREPQEQGVVVSFGAHKETDDTVTPYMSATVIMATNKGPITQTSEAMDLETALGMARAKIRATIAANAKKDAEEKAKAKKDKAA